MRELVTCMALLTAGCADVAGVDLSLVPDPNVNTAEEVRAALDTIVMIVDSADGLYAPGSERSLPGVQIENADSDPALELVATIGLPPDRLPRIRLEQGSLPDDASLELRLLGMPPTPGAPAVAIGRVQGVRLEAPVSVLDVPFNLRPELLPPRVTEVLPSDGSTLAGCDVAAVYMMFSRPIDPASVEGAVTIEPGTVSSVRLDPSGLTLEVGVSGLSGDGTSMRYRVAAAPRLADLDGRALDQVPSEPGAQGYDREFVVSCGPPRSTPEEPCGSPDVTPLSPTCGAPRLACIDGWCVPSGCEPSACEAGTACDPATSRCELDCRAWGEAAVCPSTRPRCDERGLCVE